MTLRPLLALACLAVVPGCVPTVAPSSTRPSTNPADLRLITPALDVTGSPTGPADSRASATGRVDLDVYLVEVPAGTVSGDEAFWRTVDENAVGAGAGRRLADNGVRCGVAPRSQWPKFADVVARQQGRSRRTRTGAAATGPQSVELELDQPVDHEDVFVIPPDGHPQGRTFDHAVNGVRLTFAPTPRVPRSVRLSFCPTVRRDRRVLEFTPLNAEYEQPASDVVCLYDVGLTADVPTDSFFVVAAGPVAVSDPDTVGGRFFMRNDPAARREQVIVAVPTLTPLDGSTVHLGQH